MHRLIIHFGREILTDRRKRTSKAAHHNGMVSRAITR
jgi:hypothetical protein